LFITENQDHIKAARNLGIKTLQYGTDGFVDWLAGLLEIATQFAPGVDYNLRLAIKLFGKINGLEKLEFVSLQDDIINATATEWISIDDSNLEELDGLNVAVPVNVKVLHSSDSSTTYAIDRSAIEHYPSEMMEFVKSLQAHGQIEGAKDLNTGGLPIGGASHYVETGSDGLRRLKRKGFSK
jgi:hypothetical protein